MSVPENGQGWTGEQASEISNLIVKLLTEFTGRGATKARTHLSEDLVTVVLQDSLTKGERSLVREGKSDLVLEVRLAYQQTMGPQMTVGIERVTGRKVRAFLSANHIEPDIAIETFVLEELAPA